MVDSAIDIPCRWPNASPTSTTVLRFATGTTPIPETVDTFETRRRNASPKATTVLLFAMIFGRGRLRTLANTRRTLANAPHGFRVNSQPPDSQPQNENPSAAHSGKTEVQFALEVATIVQNLGSGNVSVLYWVVGPGCSG